MHRCVPSYRNSDASASNSSHSTSDHHPQADTDSSSNRYDRRSTQQEGRNTSISSTISSPSNTRRQGRHNDGLSGTLWSPQRRNDPSEGVRHTPTTPLRFRDYDMERETPRRGTRQVNQSPYVVTDSSGEEDNDAADTVSYGRGTSAERSSTRGRNSYRSRAPRGRMAKTSASQSRGGSKRNVRDLDVFSTGVRRTRKPRGTGTRGWPRGRPSQRRTTVRKAPRRQYFDEFEADLLGDDELASDEEYSQEDDRYLSTIVRRRHSDSSEDDDDSQSMYRGRHFRPAADYRNHTVQRVTASLPRLRRSNSNPDIRRAANFQHLLLNMREDELTQTRNPNHWTEAQQMAWLSVFAREHPSNAYDTANRWQIFSAHLAAMGVMKTNEQCRAQVSAYRYKFSRSRGKERNVNVSEICMKIATPV